MKKSIDIKAVIKSALLIAFGSAIYAVGFVWCFQPNDIAFGGLTGLAQILNHLFSFIPVGVTVIVLNIPLFALGFKLIGAKLLVGSLWAMLVSSVIIDSLAVIDFPPMDPILACIFGGLTLGASLGIVIGQSATTGGTDLAARLLKLKFAWLPMGRLMLCVDLVIIVLGGVAFGKLATTLYGLVALYISTLVMDMFLYGMDTAKVAYIISDRNDYISRMLVNDLDRGITILHGQGGYSGADKKVIMCAFKQKEIAAIKHAVKEADPNAFLIVCDAHEVLGEGFRAYKKDDV